MVMTLIVVLVAMLLPVIAEVTSRARQSVCLNNLRQIGIAAFSYSEEYNQYVMPGKFGTTDPGGNYNHWINYMHAELIPDPSVFRCPTLDNEDNFNPNGGDNTIVEASYIMNMIRAKQWVGNDSLNSEDKKKAWGWGSSNKYIRIQEVQAPATKIHIMDVIQGGISGAHSGILKFSQTDYGLINIVPTAEFRRVGFHHNLGFNVLMGDGHTEFMRQTAHDQWVVVIKNE